MGLIVGISSEIYSVNNIHIRLSIQLAALFRILLRGMYV